jgi:nucleoside-diphosphate-sugar epimerase
VKSVAVVGARGFVGRALARAFEDAGGWRVVAVVRDSYDECRRGEYDVLVNAAMPSRRYWARQDPPGDFRETVAKTAELFYGWRFGKFVQISSVSARCQLDIVYGRHKAAAERICGTPETLIVRLGPLYDETLTKGVLIDMLNGAPVFVSGDSRYAFAPLSFVAGWIAAHTDRRGVVEVGARSAIALRDVAAHLGGASEFSGAVDHQEMVDPEPSFPDAREVLGFLDRRRTAPGRQ